LRLALESRHSFGVRDKRLGQGLDRHVAIQPGVARPVDLAHAARPEQ